MSEYKEITNMEKLRELLTIERVDEIVKQLEEECKRNQVFEEQENIHEEFTFRNKLLKLINIVVEGGIDLLSQFLIERNNLLKKMELGKWFIRNIILFYIKIIRKDPIFFYSLIDNYYDDAEIVGEYSLIDFCVFHKIRIVRPKLFEDYNFMKHVISINPIAFQETNYNMDFNKYKQLAIHALNYEPRMYKHFNHELMSEYDVTLYAVKKDGENYIFMPVTFWLSDNILIEKVKEILIASIIMSTDEKRFHKLENDFKYQYPYLYYNNSFDTYYFRQSHIEYFTDPDIVRAIEIKIELGNDLKILKSLLQYDIPLKENIDGWLEICKEPLTISTLSGDCYSIEEWFLKDNLIEELPSELKGCDANFEEYNISDTNVGIFKKYIIDKIVETGEYPIGLVVFPEEE